MFPRIELKLLTTGELGVQNEIDAYGLLPLTGADKRSIDLLIGQTLIDEIRYNAHGLCYLIQSTGDITVEVVRHDPLNGDSIINSSSGVIHMLHLKPSVEDRLNIHVTHTIRVTNASKEIIRLALIKS